MEGSELCRLCASPASLLLPIFEAEGVRQKLAMKIKKYLPIEVDKDDSLPNRVCYTCSSTLNAWHKLIEKCVNCDKKLRKLFASPETDTTIKVEVEDSCNESKNGKVEKQVEKNEIKKNATVTCGRSERCANVASRPSNFIVQESSSPIISVRVPIQESKSSIATPPARGLLMTKCYESNSNSDEKSNSHCKSLVTLTTFPINIDCHGQAVKVAGSGQCDDAHPKCGDNSSLFSNLKDTELSRDNSVLDFKRFTCDVCRTKFSSQLELTAHTMASHSRRIRCKYCEQVCTDEHQLDAHEQFHKRDVLYCQVCKKAMSNFKLLKLHFRAHADTGLRLCNFCTSVFSDENELQNHETTHQNERQYLCDTCGKAFRFRSGISSHLHTHLDDSIARKFKCDICKMVFRSKAILKKHFVIHDDDAKNNYVCEICGKSFVRLQGLNVHVKVHSNSRPYKCDICEKAFKWKKNLRYHQHCVHGKYIAKRSVNGRKHRPVRVQCKICGKHFASKWNLYAHLKRHDNSDVSSLCHICGETVCSAPAMRRHLSKHAGLELFICIICDRNFTTKSNRDNHQRFHTGEKPFCCDECGKCFDSKSQLHVHSVIHSDARPFKCMYCPKSFRLKSHLVSHIRIHTHRRETS